jgi:hypothetical protein
MPLVTSKQPPKHLVDEKLDIPDVKFEFPGSGKRNAPIFVIEEAPRLRALRVRHQFQAGNKYTTFVVRKPWSYYLARVSDEGVVLASALFFSKTQITDKDQPGLCAAPLPNIDYGTYKTLGVCLWVHGKSWAKDQKLAALNCHEYIWTSNYNTGVTYYEKGRPKEIMHTAKQADNLKRWLYSMGMWQKLTRADKEPDWIPVEDHQHKMINTLNDAYKSLGTVVDGHYS